MDELTEIEDHPIVSNPDSLFDLSIQLIGHNIDLVESFVGFPSQVGEKIYHVTVETLKFKEDVAYMTQGLRLFCEAFGAEIMSSLNAAGEHLGLNYSLESLLLFTHLSCLDVSGCSLGDNHEILSHITHLHSLEKLYLNDNAITDAGVQKMTAPYRMFHRGPHHLHILNLAGNSGVSVMCLKYLVTFRHLHKVVLSKPDGMCSKETETAGSWTLTSSDQLHLPHIQTFGWARDLVSSWMTAAKLKSSQGRKSNKTGFYFKSRQLAELNQLRHVTPKYCSGYLIAIRKRPNIGQKPIASLSGDSFVDDDNHDSTRNKCYRKINDTAKSTSSMTLSRDKLGLKYQIATDSANQSDKTENSDNSVMGTAQRRRCMHGNKGAIRTTILPLSDVAQSCHVKSHSQLQSQSNVVSDLSSGKSVGNCARAPVRCKKSVTSKEDALNDEDLLNMYSGATDSHSDKENGLLSGLDNIFDDKSVSACPSTSAVRKIHKLPVQRDIRNKRLVYLKDIKKEKSNSAQPKITSFTKLSEYCEESVNPKPLILLKPSKHSIDKGQSVSNVQENHFLKQRKKIKLLANNGSHTCDSGIKRKLADGDTAEASITKQRKVSPDTNTADTCTSNRSQAKTSMFDALDAFD